MKLFTIGDSVAQGYMSAASARTDLCFSTLLAKCLGISSNYSYPVWEKGGIPINIENLLRELENRFGNSIDKFEWFSALPTINNLLQETENYYETGGGDEYSPYPVKISFFHNVSVEGFKISDAWNVNAKMCKTKIEEAEKTDSDVLFGLVHTPPVASHYRIAQKVLNPSLSQAFEEFSQLDWLRYHSEKKGVENLILWLGNNNVLGTVTSMSIKQTDMNTIDMKWQDVEDKGWNLWKPCHFEAEYKKLLELVVEKMKNNKKKNWKVFVGNIPYLTILPIIKGVGPQTTIDKGNGKKWKYYKYYVYFPLEEESIKRTEQYLSLSDALYIDECIEEYNNSIAALLDSYNQKLGVDRFFLVDTADMLTKLAWKRNNGQPSYKLDAVSPVLKYMYPKVNTKYYHADSNGRLRQGGIFSLDGVHPSAIAHGLLAHEFMKVMKDKNVDFKKDLDWNEIIKNDSLYSKPISLMQDVYEHVKLAEFLIKHISI
jgi:hypothetical protein